jgi:hypothetical protein
MRRLVTHAGSTRARMTPGVATRPLNPPRVATVSVLATVTARSPTTLEPFVSIVSNPPLLANSAYDAPRKYANATTSAATTMASTLCDGSPKCLAAGIQRRLPDPGALDPQTRDAIERRLAAIPDDDARNAEADKIGDWLVAGLSAVDDTEDEPAVASATSSTSSSSVAPGSRVDVDVDDDSHTTFYHGTTSEIASRIRIEGIDLSIGNPAADFGQGFYMSKSRTDALWSGGRNANGAPLDVVEFRIPDAELAKLSALEFPGPTSEWQQFVIKNKGLDGAISSSSSSSISADRGPHDMVTGPLFRRVKTDVGPIAWPDRSPQTSIHTPTAAALFNAYMVRYP